MRTLVIERNDDVNQHFTTNSRFFQKVQLKIKFKYQLFICINVSVLINMQFIHDYYTLQKYIKNSNPKPIDKHLHGTKKTFIDNLRILGQSTLNKFQSKSIRRCC